MNHQQHQDHEDRQDVHGWFNGHIATYLAHGLSDEERARFDAHVGECEACARELASAREQDEALQTILGADKRPGDFEDRVIVNFRNGLTHRRFELRSIHPFVRNAAAVVAASVLVATIGYVGSTRFERSERVRAASNLRTMGQALLQYSNDTRSTTKRGDGWTDKQSLPTSQSLEQSALARRTAGVETRRSYTDYAFDRAINEANAAVQRNDFSAAADAMKRARDARNADPSLHSPKELKRFDEKLDETRKKVTDAEIASRNEQNSASQDDSTRLLRDRLSRDRSTQRDTIRDLVRSARQYVEQAKYREALGVIDQIILIDPENDYAAGVRPLIAKRVGLGEKGVPYNDILRYPDNWPQLAELRDKNKSVQFERGELIADQQAAVQIDRVLPDINFNGIAFSDTIEFMRDITQTNIFVNWKALEAAGVSRNMPITAKLSKLKLAQALSALLEAASANGAKLGYVIDDGVISISTADDLARSTRAPTTQPADADDGRAIIRTGTIEFEIDNFESTFEQIKRITEAARGYIGTVASERLTNGKVRGTITLRVPPARTDDVINKLRPLGQILRQNIAAEEVTQQIADLSRQLETAQTMQQRLSNLSTTSSTQPVKQRVEAEREAGEWRAKAEQAQSQIETLQNKVALATITVVLNEKGLHAAAILSESESVELNAETPDVERARADAIKAIDAAKGRIVESSLKQFDAGQLAARVVAEVSSEKTGEVVDRLRQLGKVARMDVQRATATPDNRPAAVGSRVERKDTRIVASFYNLANVAPRVSSSVNIACDDVEAAYRAVNERVIKANGRIITSNVNRRASDGAAATIQFEVKSDDADAMLNDIRATGEVMRLESTQNTDTNNVTSAKRGFAVQLISTASAEPRQVTTRSLAASDVTHAYNALLAVANKSNARVIASQLRQDANQPASAILHFDARRDDAAAIDAAIAAAGDAIGGEIVQSNDNANTLASKVQYKLTLVSADQLPPRETTTLAIETRDVDASASAVTRLVGELGGRVIDSNVASETSGRTTARVVVELPLAKLAEAIDRAKERGTVRSSQSTRNQQTNNAGQLARARVEIIFATPDAIVGADAGFWASIRNGLATSAAGLMWSLRMLVIGVCLVTPWVIVIGAGWRIAKRIYSSVRTRGEVR